MSGKYQNRRWRLYVAIAAGIIVAVSIWYTNIIVNELAESERNKIEIFTYSIQALAEVDVNDLDQDISNQFEAALKVTEGIPLIIVDDANRIYESYNFSDSLSDTEEERLLQNIQKNGPPPIINTDPNAGYAKYFYYTRSRSLQLLSYFPLIQILLIAVFVIISYIGLTASRKEEQNRVWVGMAKETAHQLGTPISGIIAWLELLKGLEKEDDEVQMIVTELGQDVDRLNLIADRFSKIGSKPELFSVDLRQPIEKTLNYMERRSPKKVHFIYEKPDEALFVRLNPPLFEWVLENMIRNALDAMEGKGSLKVELIPLPSEIQIDISDTGKGIATKRFRKVFEPGYSTKKRGWGLGLSLAKRIITSYHKGEIFVKKSAPGEGTTFSILLPRN